MPVSKRVDKWWPVLLAWLLALCLAAPATALTDYRLGDQSILPEGAAELAGAELGAAYQGPATADGFALHLDGAPASLSQAVAGASTSAAAAVAATSWWYLDTSRYRVLVPGNANGPYADYAEFGLGLSAYLGDAYGAAVAVLGANNHGYGKINLWLDYEAGYNAAGWYYQGQGYNDISLNLWTGGTTAYYGGVAAHETTHLLFDHETDLYNRDPVANSWVTEALAWYVGRSVYVHGDQVGYAHNSALLRYYSQDGARRSSWYDSGARYNGLVPDPATNLDYVQMETIGFFLANSTQGWSAIQRTVDHLAAGLGIDAAFALAYYGLTTGMRDTASGPGVNTLYSQYLNYYLGHY